MMICKSCGGIIGHDCFNPIECAIITERMNQQQNGNEQARAYDEGYQLGWNEGYQAAMNDLKTAPATDTGK